MLAGAFAVTGLVACSTGEDASAPKDTSTTESQAAGQPVRPMDSPQAQPNLPGDTGKGIRVKDVARVGANDPAAPIAVLSDNQLRIGPVSAASDLLSASAGRGIVTVTLPKGCTDLNTSAAGVTVACDTVVKDVDKKGKELHSLDVPERATSAVFAKDGTAAVGQPGTDKLAVISPGGEKKAFTVSNSTDELVLMNGDSEKLAAIDHGQTRVSDVSMQDKALNAALRIGQGVGTVANGRGDDGVLIASDAHQDQLQMFTLTDVVRMHQAAPTGPGPWGVTWDSGRHLAWVSTTGDNMLKGYSVDQGTPLAKAAVPTIASVRHIIDGADGEVLLLSGDGHWQKLDKKQIQSALDKGAPGAEEFPVKVDS